MIMLAYGCVALQQLISAQQQFGKIDHTLAFELVLIKLIDFNQAATVRIPDLDLPGALAFFLGAVDKALDITRRKFIVVDAGAFQQALDRRQLIGAIQYLKRLDQAGIAVVGAQQAVEQALKKDRKSVVEGKRVAVRV